MGSTRDPWDRCVQILGFDVMLDENLKAYLLEINDHPSLRSPTPLDKVIKAGVIRKTLELLDPDTSPLKFRRIEFCNAITYKPVMEPKNAHQKSSKNPSEVSVSKQDTSSKPNRTKSAQECDEKEAEKHASNSENRVGRMKMLFSTILPEKKFDTTMPDVIRDLDNIELTREEL